MDLALAGKVAIVTGASTGIGRATADALAAEGAIVVGASRRAPQTPVRGVTHRCSDLAEPGAAADLVASVTSAHGRLDVLVNNAARGTLVSGVADEALASWRETLALNLLAVVEAMGAALPYLEAARGAIVNVSSVNARLPSTNAPSYSASKAALLNVTKAVADEYAGRVRANVVSPGLTATPMWLGEGGVASQIEALTGTPADEVARTTAAQMPLQRFLEPDEVAAAICFLASPRASAITGVDLIVDGGLLKGA